MVVMYAGFVLLILVLLALDLGVFNRKVHVISVREALGWSAFWIALGLLFGVFIYFGYENHWLGLGRTPDMMGSADAPADGSGIIYNDGPSAVVKYVTGYLVEKSLAVDNIFVISMIFSLLAVPPLYQHRVLFWGITGAVVMRGAMIALGTTLLLQFSWIIYVFGGFLVLTGIKMLLLKDGGGDQGARRIIRITRRFIPIAERFHGEHFFVRAGSAAAREPEVTGLQPREDAALAPAPRGRLFGTPLFLALVLIEVTDLIFAVDSIPAIFAITADPFLVFTSNIFAILGLRSLYFALAGMIARFHHLKTALAVVLVVVGLKMVSHGYLKALLGGAFNFYVLGVVLFILAAGVAASLLTRPAHEEAPS